MKNENIPGGLKMQTHHKSPSLSLSMLLPLPVVVVLWWWWWLLFLIIIHTYK